VSEVKVSATREKALAGLGGAGSTSSLNLVKK